MYVVPGRLYYQKYMIWVLAPYLESDDPNIRSYYDFTQSIAEYAKVFNELECDWKWQPVTMENFRQIIAGISKQSGKKTPLVINLCDGDEVNGTPGVSVIEALDEYKLRYTGADTYFYDITTSKIPMKKAFDQYSVSTAPWEVIKKLGSNANGIFDRLGSPIIIKPAVSGGSMGLTIKNVVESEKELKARVKELYKGYRGWNLTVDGLFVERFIKGREFTTLVVGSSNQPEDIMVYQPVERVFHESLPETEKFLSFDRLWETYEEETPMPDNEFVYDYFAADEELSRQLVQLSKEAYTSVGGQGYARLDMRMDTETGKLYMLEVNAQCGLSEDEDYTSIGAILRYSEKTFTNLISEIMQEGLVRKSKPATKTAVAYNS